MDISFEPLPLVIGVTGHRDLCETDIPRLRMELHAIFRRLDDNYANPPSRLERMQRQFFSGMAARKRPGATPMIVLSALAEGADQLVAQVATERGLRVIAPLPLPPEQYRDDFKDNPVSADALEVFDKLMARSDIQKLFVGYEEGSSPEDVKAEGAKRDLQYRRVGAFITRHCDVLIALWDGKPSEATGGTAEIVDFKRNGIPLDASKNAHASLDAPEIGPVIHIVTRRATKEDSAGVSVACWGAKQVRQELNAALKPPSAPQKEIAALAQNLWRWESFEPLAEQSREFNRDAVGLLTSPQGRAKARPSFLRLFEADEKKPETITTALQARTIAPRYCDLHAVADALAQDRQAVFRRDWLCLLGIFLFAFGCYEAFSHLVPIVHAHGTPPLGRRLDRALLAGYVLALGAIFAWYTVAIRGRHQERFVDYRAFAEALRVAMFWRLAGIEGAADAYPIKMPRELAWVKTCLLVQELFDKAASADEATRGSLNSTSYDWIRQIWIEGQLRYFRRTQSKHNKAADWRERWSTRILIAIAFLAVGLFLLVLQIVDNPAFEPVSGWLGPGQWARDLFLFVIGVLPGVAAFLIGYSEKLAFNAMARQYNRMAELFKRADDILPATLPDANSYLVRDAVCELGAEAMRENAEWVSMYRQRPLSVHPS